MKIKNITQEDVNVVILATASIMKLAKKYGRKDNWLQFIVDMHNVLVERSKVLEKVVKKV